MNQNFDWMTQEAIYEPRPTIQPARPEPIPLGWRIFLILAVLVIVGGALAAVAQ